MKLTKAIFLILFFSGSFKIAHSQTINWASLKDEHKHIVNPHAGFDYAFNYGVAYSYQVQTPMPVLLNVDFSTPVGEIFLDDFKTKIGGMVRVYKVNDVQFSASLYGIYRRYENTLARLQNFGSEMTGVIGYYKPTWFVAGEFGFDKAIVTHFKHSNLFKENFPAVKDGWYQPATGGNFKYGFQAGYSFRSSDIMVKVGRVITQDFKTNPTIPFYAEIGYNFKMTQSVK
jgi:hypothetical protein